MCVKIFVEANIILTLTVPFLLCQGVTVVVGQTFLAREACCVVNTLAALSRCPEIRIELRVLWCFHKKVVDLSFYVVLRPYHDGPFTMPVIHHGCHGHQHKTNYQDACNWLLPHMGPMWGTNEHHTAQFMATCSSDHMKWRLVRQKVGNLGNINTQNLIIWVDQTTEPFVYYWQCANATFKVTCFPAFVAS